MIHMTGVKVHKSVLENASAFLDPKYTIDDLYAILGMQLDAVEALDKPKSLDKWMSKGVDIAKMKVDFIRKAREFLEKWWHKIVENSCAWWKDNRDKFGKELLAGLATAIAPVLPPPWGWIGGIVAAIAAILIKAGFDAICIRKKKPAKIL